MPEKNWRKWEKNRKQGPKGRYVQSDREVDTER